MPDYLKWGFIGLWFVLAIGAAATGLTNKNTRKRERDRERLRREDR